MLPTDPRIMGLSPFQELWIYTHLKRKQKIRSEEDWEKLKVVCSFINPKAAKSVFEEQQVSESEGFYEDLASIAPKSDLNDYKEILEAMGAKR